MMRSSILTASSLAALQRHPPIIYQPGLSIPWPKTHTFSMWKFKDLAQALVSDGLVRSPSDFVSVEPEDLLSETQFLRCHGEAYYRGFVEDTLSLQLARRIGFTARPDHDLLVRRTLLECAATMKAARCALAHGVAVSCGGGTHHAHRHWGSGFTAINDLAVVAAHLTASGGEEAGGEAGGGGGGGSVERVVIVDLDVHQGDGTAEILADTPNAFTMSMHCESNFPLGFYQEHLGKDSSDLDVPLPTGTGDAAYLSSLAAHLPALLDDFTPGLVLYDAGIDPYEGDRLGKLCLSEQGLYDRDAFVFAQCARRGIPVAAVIGGGYDRDRLALARRHAIVHRAATDLWLLGVFR